MRNTIHILFGTTTGNSEHLAEETAENLSRQGFTVQLCGMNDFDPTELSGMKTLLVIVSTDCNGEPPLMAEDFYHFLNETEMELRQLSFSVLGLGDSYYADFCRAGKDFDRMLEEPGAHRIVERVDCDIDYWEAYDRWFDNVLSAIGPKEKVLN